jgi:hypothetical protein
VKFSVRRGFHVKGKAGQPTHAALVEREESHEEAEEAHAAASHASVLTPRALEDAGDGELLARPLSPRYTLSEAVDRYTYQPPGRDWRSRVDAGRARRCVHSDAKVANRVSRVWHGATETGP